MPHQPFAGAETDGVVNIHSSRDCAPTTQQARADRWAWTKARNVEVAERRASRRRAALRRERAADVRSRADARTQREREARRDARQESQALAAGGDDTTPAPPATDYTDVVDFTDTTATDFPTPPGDPNGLDADGDGVSCES